jgi:hypothetical protein
LIGLHYYLGYPIKTNEFSGGPRLGLTKWAGMWLENVETLIPRIPLRHEKHTPQNRQIFSFIRIEYPAVTT